jgi:hypothetical protein
MYEKLAKECSFRGMLGCPLTKEEVDDLVKKGLEFTDIISVAQDVYCGLSIEDCLYEILSL